MAQTYRVTIRCDSQFSSQVLEAVKQVERVGDLAYTLAGRESTIELVTPTPGAVQGLSIVTLVGASVSVEPVD